MGTACTGYGNLIARQAVPLDGVACCRALEEEFRIVNNTCVLLNLLAFGVVLLNVVDGSLDALW